MQGLIGLKTLRLNLIKEPQAEFVVEERVEVKKNTTEYKEVKPFGKIDSISVFGEVTINLTISDRYVAK